MDAIHKSIDGFAHGQVQHLAVEDGVVAGRPAKADHLPTVEAVFARPLGRQDHLGSLHIHHVEIDLGVGHLGDFEAAGLHGGTATKKQGATYKESGGEQRGEHLHLTLAWPEPGLYPFP